MQTSTTTCAVSNEASTTICITESSGFSYGEAFLGFVLLLFFTTYFFSTLKTLIIGHKIEQPVKMKYDK